MLLYFELIVALNLSKLLVFSGSSACGTLSALKPFKQLLNIVWEMWTFYYKCVLFPDNHMYQYFLQVVPTKVDTTFSVVDTYQYAATESVCTSLSCIHQCTASVNQS